MLTVNLRTAKEAIKKLYKVGRSIVLMGSPGIGKSSVYPQVAKEDDMNCIVTEASSLDPCDTRGIPFVHEGESRYGRPSMLPKESDGDKGFLVIDELASCMPATQVSLYPLFLERRLGEFPLPKGWLPMGTGNYSSDGAVAFNLSTALTDRVFILNVEPDLKVWKEDFAIPNNINQRIISFLNFRKDLFYTFDKREKRAKGKAFASPRSYHMASDALSTGLEGIALHAVLAGCLSEGVATELIAFMKIFKDLPDVEKIYRGKINSFPKEPDQQYAMSGALVGFLSDLPEGLSKSVALGRLLDYTMKSMPPEFAVLTIKDAWPKYGKLLCRVPSWNAWDENFRDFTVASKN